MKHMVVRKDWLGKPYYSLNAYFRNTYGKKIYKIAVDAGLTCPNRDGSLDNRGCIFCSAGGSGDFAVKADSVKTQIEKGLERFNKHTGDEFVIYFQAFTNTYGDLEYLKKIWTDALEYNQVVGISIATRPDCLGSAVMELLKKLKEKYEPKGKFIWVEMGLQTIHDKTATYIRRHYPLETYEQAVLNLGRLEIPYITHIIFGLPGETREEMLQTVFYVEQGIYDSEKNIQRKPFGIKLQLLHVLKNTDLALEYAKGNFRTMDMEEYISIVIEALEQTDPDIVIHRLTGDGSKSLLIAPDWSADKKRVLNTLHKRMAEKNAVQGDYSIMLLHESS